MITTRMIGSTALAGLMLGASLAPASADTVGHWAAIGELGAGTKSTTVSMPSVTGFPQATLTTDSATPAGRISGASTWLGASTEVGAVYGSSRNQPYLNLRPAKNNANAPSTSTYTFDSPTPASGWNFTLGDIDAEFLDVTATGIDGETVALGDLGFRSTFNYCLGAGTPSCDADKPQPAPAWDPAEGRLTGPRFDSNDEEIVGWSDTDGAAAWFEPTVPLTSVTVTSTWRKGFPTYQTWFGALSRDASGTVAGTAECSTEGLAVTILDNDGTEVATTTTDDNGNWTIKELATYPDWTVVVSPPEGCVVDPDGALTADLSEDDAVVDVNLQPDEAPAPTPEPTDPAPTPEPTDPAPTTPAPTAAPTSPGPGVAPAEQVSSSLPDTGGSSLWWLIGGGALLLGGAGALVAGSLRRR